MRSLWTTAGAAGIMTVMLTIVPAASADPNDVMSQAQRLFGLGNGGNGLGNEDAYRRGQQDEMRRQQVEREQRRLDRQHDSQYGYRSDTRRDDQYRYPSGYRRDDPSYRGY